MSYQTILVHVDQSVHAPARMRYAAALAQAHGAHLVGAAMLGLSRSVFPNGYDEEQDPLASGDFEPLAENAKRALAQFEAIAAGLQLPHDGKVVCAPADEALARLARFADLVVISQEDPDESMPDMAVHLPEYVILNSPRPVLLVPRAGPTLDASRRALLTWDGSKEAARALGAAVPLLRHASAVTVAALTGPDGSTADFQAQQVELLDFLDRHRVKADFMIRAPRRDSGHELLALVEELHCGLLVMGCFGHSRFRELCLGGASRTVLAEAGIPVLMAH